MVLRLSRKLLCVLFAECRRIIGRLELVLVIVAATAAAVVVT